MNTNPDRKTQLLTRLDQIGQAIAATGQGLALLGLGSVGTELARLDEFSDLDFYVIAQPGQKHRFLDHLDWLGEIAYTFQNSPDGHKTLLADGIFCEWAVFEPSEMPQIVFAEGRLVWQHPAFDPSILNPRRTPAAPNPVAWAVGEALTNLYVGLCRYHRGEKLTAARFIQWYALDRVLELTHQIETEQPDAFPDVFGNERRFEQRFPQMAAHLPTMNQGYTGSLASAQAILEFLEQHFEVNPAMAAKIRELLP